MNALQRLAGVLAALTLSAIAAGVSAAPTFQAAGAAQASAGGGTTSVPWPAHQAGDVALLFIESSGGQAATLSTAAGFTAVAGSPQATGTGANGTRLTVYWARATSAAMAPPAYTNPGNHSYARILTYRGVIATGNPWNVTGGGVKAALSGTVTVTGVVTTVADTLVVQAVARDNDSAAAAFSAQTNANLTGIAERSDGGTTNGNGGGIGIWDGVKATAGATGNTTATVTSSRNAFLTIALRPAPALDHFAISHAGSGVACDAHAITITAHDASHNPVDANALTVNLSTTNGRGTWTGIQAGGGTLSDPVPGDGAATYSFAVGSNSVTLLFSYANLATNPETFGFNVSGGGFSETTGTAAVTEDPAMTLSLAGFRFRNVSDGNGTVVTQISGKPSNAGFNAKTVRLQAINTDTGTGACVNQFANQTRTVQLGGECNIPATCAGRQIAINGSSIATSNDNGGAGAAAYTDASLAFDANSEADTVIAYPDAGQISVHARYDLDPGTAGFEMIGASNPFVVRPFGLAFRGADAATTIPHASSAAGTLLAAAGDNFTMTLAAYQWAAGEDANSDGVPDTGANITDNGTVPNFAATAAVSAGANLPGVALGSVARGAGCSSPPDIALAGGSATATDWCYGEAGNVILSAAVTDYLAAGVNVGGTSGLDGDAGGGYVGRFKPKYFEVTGATTLGNRAALACAPASSFTYMNEGLELGFSLEARNTQGALTQNYTGAYAKLDLSTAASLGIGARSGGGANLTARVDLSVAPTGNFTSGVADISIVTGVRRAAPDSPDGPYAGTRFGVAPNDGDPDAANGVRLAAFDLDVDGAGGDEHFTIGPPTELRFGRLWLQNAYGSGASVLPVPIQAQYWNGSAFAVNAADSCTALARSAIALTFGAPLAPCNAAVNAASVPFSSGVGTLVLSAPGAGAQGSVLLAPNLGSAGGSYCDPASYVAAGSAPLGYLLGRWNDADNPDGDGTTAYDDKPGARAVYGRYAQPRNFIFYRENY